MSATRHDYEARLHEEVLTLIYRVRILEDIVVALAHDLNGHFSLGDPIALEARHIIAMRPAMD